MKNKFKYSSLNSKRFLDKQSKQRKCIQIDGREGKEWVINGTAECPLSFFSCVSSNVCSSIPCIHVSFGQTVTLSEYGQCNQSRRYFFRFSLGSRNYKRLIGFSTILAIVSLLTFAYLRSYPLMVATLIPLATGMSTMIVTGKCLQTHSINYWKICHSGRDREWNRHNPHLASTSQEKSSLGELSHIYTKS